jgi:RHS repeat-associated protein
LTSIIYPGSKTVAYQYDSAGRLNRVTDWLGNTAAYTYDKTGAIIEESRPNGTKVQYKYSSDLGRLASLNNVGVAGNPLPQFSYTYDNAGNILSITLANVDATAPTIQDTTCSYDDADRILQAKDVTYEYDKNGNLVHETSPVGGETFTFDADNELVGVATPVATYAYEYDPQGARVSRKQGAATTLYACNQLTSSWDVLMRTDGAGNPLDYFIYGLGLAWRIDATTNAVFCYHFDHLGSTVAITDSNGHVVARYSYGPFGESVSASGADWNPFCYVGKFGVQDEGNGLLFMRSRYYVRQLGRFMSRDCRGFIVGSNQYAYGEDNPIGRIDPSGRNPEDAKKEVVMSALGAAAPHALGDLAGLGQVSPSLVTELVSIHKNNCALYKYDPSQYVNDMDPHPCQFVYCEVGEEGCAADQPKRQAGN